MEQSMTPNVSRDDSEDDHLCRSIQLLRRGRPIVQGECHLPDLRSSSIDQDMQHFMNISHLKQDEYCSTPHRETSDDHIHLPWGRLVTDRNKVPDLMSEDVDEEIEQFMILPLKQRNESSPSRHKRRHDNNQEHSSHLDGASPTSKQRTNDCFQSCDLQREVARWFQESLDCEKTNVDSVYYLDEKHEWNENWKCPDGMPAPKALRRQSPLAREKVHSKILELEALLSPPPAPRQECNKRQQAVSLQDSDQASLSFISRFDSTRNDRHGEVYPGRRQVKMIHGNDSSRDSLRNGHATTYPCVGCRQSCLVANNGTKLLYCHRCGMLTPTDISGEVEGV